MSAEQQDLTSKTRQKPVDVFITYSTADRAWLDRILTLLRPLVRNGRIAIWADPHIKAGDEWRHEINEALSRAQVALLLVSADFLASTFIMEIELPRLVEQKARLIPVLVSACAWEDEPLVARLQWVFSPHRESSLAQSHSGSRDARLMQVYRAISRAVDDTYSSLPNDATPKIEHRWRAEASPATEKVYDTSTDKPLGTLHKIPQPPIGNVMRDEYADLRGALIERGEGPPLSTQEAAMGLIGPGGIGKSVLASVLARDVQVRAQFVDGVYWVSLGEHSSVFEAQVDLLRELNINVASITSVTAALNRLASVLAGKQVLLVIDDVWSRAALDAFCVTGTGGRILYTTREEPALAPSLTLRHVGPLSQANARQLVAGVLGVSINELPGDTDELINLTQGVPLPLALAAAAIRGGSSWELTTVRLRQAGAIFVGHPYANTFKSMQVTLSTLRSSSQELYFSLAVLPPDTAFPIATLEIYWTRLMGIPSTQTRDVVEKFAQSKLVTFEDGAISLHDLQHDYIHLHAQNTPLLHLDLLEAYRTTFDSENDGWWQLPRADAYIWNNLLHHLFGSGNTAEALKTACDVAFIAGRLAQGGPRGLERDLRRVSDLRIDADILPWLLRWVPRYGYLFSDAEIEEVGPTMAGCLASAPSELNIARLNRVLPEMYVVAELDPSKNQDALLRVLIGHTRWVSSVAYSPDGHKLATVSDDGTVRVWNPDSGLQEVVIDGHVGTIVALAFNPREPQIATGADAGCVNLWNSESGASEGILSSEGEILSQIEFRRDGRVLAAVNEDGSVDIWEIESGDEPRKLDRQLRPVLDVAFDPHSQQLASVHEDGYLRLWNSRTLQCTTSLHAHDGQAINVKFNPVTLQLVTTGGDGLVCLWNRSSIEDSLHLRGHVGPVDQVVFSSDGTRLATAGADGTTRIWSTSDGSTVATVALDGHLVESLTFSPDGSQLATVGADATVRLWDSASGELQATLRGHSGAVSSVAYRPVVGGQIATVGDDATVRIWDPSVEDTSAATDGHTGAVWVAAYRPGGGQIASGGDDAIIRLWTHTGRALGEPLTAHTEAVWALVYRPDGQQLASGGADAALFLWDPDLGTRLHTLNGHTGPIEDLKYSGDGRLLVSVGDDGRICLWDTISGNLLQDCIAHSDWIRGVAFSPDGSEVITTGYDRTVHRWLLEEDRHETIMRSSAPMLPATYTENGDRILLGSNDGDIVILDRYSAAELLRATAHSGAVRGLIELPGGRHVLSVGDDGTVRIWLMANGLKLISGTRLGITRISSVSMWKRSIVIAMEGSASRLQIVGDLSSG